MNFQQALKRWLAQLAGFIKSFVWPSLYEAVYILLVSNASLLVLVFIYLVNTKGATISSEVLSKVVSDSVNSSEVLIYVLALVAPATWIMISNWKGKRHFEFYWLLLFIQAGIVFGSAILYSMSKSTGVINSEFASDWATICLVLGAVIWYITLVYEKWLPSVAEKMQAQGRNAVLSDLENDV